MPERDISAIELYLYPKILKYEDKLILYNLECNLATLINLKNRYKESDSKTETVFLSTQLSRISNIINNTIEYIRNDNDMLKRIIEASKEISEHDELSRFPYFFIDFPNPKFKKYKDVGEFINRLS